MHLMIPNDQTLVAIDDRKIQQIPHQVVWADEQQAQGTVEMLPEQPDAATWVDWVERVGGQWASEAELAEI